MGKHISGHLEHRGTAPGNSHLRSRMHYPPVLVHVVLVQVPVLRAPVSPTHDCWLPVKELHPGAVKGLWQGRHP